MTVRDTEKMKKVERDKDMLYYAAQRLYRAGMRYSVILDTISNAIYMEKKRKEVQD